MNEFKRGVSRVVVASLGLALFAGCVTDDVGIADDGTEPELGTAEQAIAACPGDDPNYDFNSLAASLAVATAQELGRWDANADFVLTYGKLELSTTGKMRCAAGCPNVTTLLRMQDDSTANVPGHSPSIYRQKLSTWYQAQTQALTALVAKMLTVDKGIYRLQANHSGKYMAVDNGSTLDGASVEQQGELTTGADQWRLVLQNGKHRFINVKSGKCLTLSADQNADNVAMVQKTCSTYSMYSWYGTSPAPTQEFEFAELGGGRFAIRNKWLKALTVSGSSLANDARVTQLTWNGPSLNQQWALVPVGTGVHIAPQLVSTAVYQLAMKHSGKALAVDNGSMLDGAVIEQGTYVSTDDRFHWYVTPVGNGYQFINRRSGKCIALASDVATAGLVQKTCSTSPTQIFNSNPVGDGTRIIHSSFGKALEIAGASLYNDAKLTQAADGTWSDQRLVRMTPIMAGEPHRLVFEKTTNDAPCGDAYYWYDIAQPNLQPLHAPEDSFIQLIFVGGKQTLTGTDLNPFIAQQVSGNLVAIDPTYGLNDLTTTTTGSCAAACTKISATSILGQCCTCNSVNRKFAKSAWSTTTYLCQ
jgi:hypothetical protein